MLKNKKRGQVWVETAIYTLVGLTIIVILLSIANPQIKKIKDKTSINQAMETLREIDKAISQISSSAPGNSKTVLLSISKGEITVDSLNDEIIYLITNTDVKFSEVGTEIKEGKLYILTEEYGSNFNVYVKLKYDNLNITYEKKENKQEFHAGTTPYQIVLENVEPTDLNAMTLIDFSM